ncbi:MAG: hypothetical protein HY290_06885 [Planctomycetia bacterium]|nr:hypothetical protein [Planctomycetia bacterium]
MPISCECPECGKRLKAADSAAGKKAKCPDCGAAVPIPVKKKPKPKSAEESEFDLQSLDIDAGMAGPVEEEQIACPACSEMINATAGKCRYCGENLSAPRKKKKGKRSRSGPGIPVSIIVAVAVECLFICFNLFAIVRVLTMPTPALPANLPPERAQIVKMGNTAGVVLQGVLVLIEVAIAVGLLQGKNAVRILALILDGIGAAFFVICGGVGLFIGMQAMAQMPQGQEGIGLAFALLLGRGALYLIQFGALQTATARDFLSS